MYNARVTGFGSDETFPDPAKKVRSQLSVTLPDNLILGFGISCDLRYLIAKMISNLQSHSPGNIQYRYHTAPTICFKSLSVGTVRYLKASEWAALRATMPPLVPSPQTISSS